YYLILIGCVIAAIASLRISDSPTGRAWVAMREDEDVAEATGINLVRHKLLAFALGASFAGIGGAIFASWVHSVFPNSFTLLVSINILSLVIVGGLGSIPGVVIGALVLVGLPEALRAFADYRLLTFGALLVLMMLARPEGLWPAQHRRRELSSGNEEKEPAT
ncbi:MAG: branched-chain amino acid ABC transporter permease, partial [Anaerolineae bacterium]